MEKDKDNNFISENSLCDSNGEEEIISPQIEISIDSIENIIRKDVVLIKISIEHENTILGLSEIITIDSSYKNQKKLYPIDFKVFLPYIPNSRKSIAPLVSIPILIKVIEVLEDKTVLRSNSEATNKKQIQRNSKTSSQQIQTQMNEEIFGMCNIDMLPIILGETTYSELLLLEVSSYTWDNNIVAWENLPKILITLQQNETRLILSDMTFNILNMTVESIYNIPDDFTEEMEYKCGTALYPDKDPQDSCIIFDGGKWTKYHDLEKIKSWGPLHYLDSRARLSKYKISPDYRIKTDCKKFNLKAAMEKDTKRIAWNMMHRYFLNTKDICYFQDRLKKYKYWPFELKVTKNQIETEKNSIDSFSETIYQFYVDTCQLVFPGRTKLRFLSHLRRRNLFDMKQKTGLQTSIFCGDMDEESESQLEEKESESDCPVISDNGMPIFVLVEFELYQPFFPARILEDFVEASTILKNVPRPARLPYVYTPDLVYDQYVQCIKQLIEVLGESYRDFQDYCDCQSDKSSDLSDASKCVSKKLHSCKKSNSSSPTSELSCPYSFIPDDINRFKQYLHETGVYVSMHSTLKSKIINLLDQKFPLNSADWFSIKNQDFIASCYTYLVEQMHIALNTKIDVRINEETIDTESDEHLWLRAEEEFEFQNYEKSEKLLMKIICKNRNNPDSWVMYGIYFLKMSNIDEAIECCREAIRLNSRHKIALLMYGIILAMTENYTEAEIFIKAVTNFYPRFAESWGILHLLYVKIDYCPGIDITLELAEKCLNDRLPDNETMYILDREPIAWSTILCRKHKIFLLTAVLLLKLNLHNFAGFALNQELSLCKSIEFLYFFSVNAYLCKNYRIALDYLNQAETIIGTEYSIDALMGHVYYKFGNITQAMKYYESVDMLFDRPDNIHLVHLRMGFYLIDIQEYQRAKNVFSRACKQSPTCKTWLGFGISNYHLENFEESEIALMEANRIDDEDAEVWGYFCLVSMSLNRYSEFTQCYRQAVKNNLKNDKLWNLIHYSMNKLKLQTPIIQFNNLNDKCTCLDVSWATQD